MDSQSVMILTIRTDKPVAEIGLFKDSKKIAYERWRAHRQLTATIHKKLQQILNPSTKISKLHNPLTDYSARDLVRGKQVLSLDDIEGIVVFKGPGSFTGLRIGLTVANAMAYSSNVPIVARSGQKWIQTGIKDLQAGKNDKIALPRYGHPANISKPKK